MESGQIGLKTQRENRMAFQIYATVVGAKQGTFKGEGPSKGSANRIPGVAFSYAVERPYDSSTGLATGKRQHKPVVFTKEWGISSPQFFQAAYTNETLKSVVIDFIAVAPDGKEEVDHTVTLTNASIASIEDYEFLGDKGGPIVDSRELERISFTFQKIEIDSIPGKTTAMDDWQVLA
jgi:type VI secretion system secreted protein Hcp